MWIFKNIYHFLMDKKIPTVSGSLAFFFLFNGGSFLFLYIILANFSPYSFLNLLLNRIEEGPLKEFIAYLFQYQNALPYSVFLIISSIYSASGLYYHWLHVAELVGDVRLNLSLSKRWIAVILTLIFLLVLYLITFISAFLMIHFYEISFWILVMTMLLIFLLLLYASHILIVRTFHIQKIVKGMLFTLVYFVVFSAGFLVYLSIFSNFKVIYGILSFIVILMFYIYVLCIGMVLGLYINCKNLEVWKTIFQKQ